MNLRPAPGFASIPALPLFLLLCSASCSDGSESESPGAGSGGASSTGTDGTGGGTVETGAGGGAAVEAGGVDGSGGADTGGATTGGSDTGSAGTGESQACTDDYPYDDGYDCEQQAGWGKCNEDWLAGYCNLSCGRCGEAAGAECGEVASPPDLSSDAGTAPPSDCAAASADACAFGGLVHACKDRFALGINYAWRDFGTDFGGMSVWSLGGISGQPDLYNQDLANMRANGASVIRWWMFPDLRGDGIELDDSGSPTGISEQTVTDIRLALELAQRNDVYLVFTLFSFDAFRPTRQEGDAEIPGISALVASDAGRTALVDNVVAPIAQAAADSPYATRLLGWDVINEPEWAIEATGNATNGQDFSPNDELDAVSLDDMKAFIKASLTALGAKTPNALRSVGWAAAKWAWAFADITDVDFNQPHIYKWVNDYWPYTTAPSALGYPNKPVVMGEFYLMDGPFDAETPSFDTVVSSWFDAGYAGAWAWQYFDGCVSRPGSEGLDLTLLDAFATKQGCATSF